MAELLDELSTQVDSVVIDSPPLLAVADSSILANLVSGTILVVEAGSTPLGACARAIDLIKRAEGNLLGVVLNRLNPRQVSHGSYYYYTYDADAPEGKRGRQVTEKRADRPSGRVVSRPAGSTG
ncbi:MAG TPA: CpsD/CapB family tyrosine-protein kinase [Chloroflexi bacterium]|jgi:Mrp family chromosome partitioning ATPase|nr:CpsD/CapB family tyrosine-protein kinase [Chloroflexota bacterium]